MANEQQPLLKSSNSNINYNIEPTPYIQDEPKIDNGWLIRDWDMDPMNKTEDFLRALAGSGSKAEDAIYSSNMTEHVRKYHYVFIHGFGGDNLPRYWISAIRNLEKKYKVGISIVSPISEEHSEKNAKFIKHQFKKLHNRFPNYPLFVFAHSKGGFDLLHALLKYPQIQPFVKAIVPCQSPFGGVPLAEYVLYGSRKSFSKFIYRTFINRHDPTYQSVIDFTYAERQRFFRTYNINELNVPVFCLSSKVTNSHTGVFGIMNRIVRGGEYKDVGDGLIPLLDSLIPGAMYAVLPKGNHCAAFWSCPMLTNCSIPSYKLVEKMILFLIQLDLENLLLPVSQNIAKLAFNQAESTASLLNLTPSEKDIVAKNRLSKSITEQSAEEDARTDALGAPFEEGESPAVPKVRSRHHANHNSNNNATRHDDQKASSSASFSTSMRDPAMPVPVESITFNPFDHVHEMNDNDLIMAIGKANEEKEKNEQADILPIGLKPVPPSQPNHQDTPQSGNSSIGQYLTSNSSSSMRDPAMPVPVESITFNPFDHVHEMNDNDLIMAIGKANEEKEKNEQARSKPVQFKELDGKESNNHWDSPNHASQGNQSKLE